MKEPVSMWFYKESCWYNQRFQALCGSTKNNNGTKRDFRVYVVLQRIKLVQIETPVDIQSYKESQWYKWRLQCLCGCTKNHHGIKRLHGLCGSTKIHTGTNRDSSFYIVLQRIILVQMEAPGSMPFYKETYWYKWRLQCICGSTKNHTGTLEPPGFRLFFNE